jgi:hypothetical protein
VSALPNPPQPDDIPVSVRDVGFGILIGATSWLVRYACSMEKQSCGYIFRRTVTAGLTSLLVGMATKGYLASEGIAFAAAGAAGYASPELVDAGLLWLRKHAGKGRTPPKG